jgi:hypothetical protein
VKARVRDGKPGLSSAIASPSPPADPDRAGRRRLLWGLALLALLLAIFVYYRAQWPTFRDFVGAIDHDDVFVPDFKWHYYPMCRQIFTSPTPIEGYYYPAFFALLCSPLGLMPPLTALAVWVAFQVLAAAGLVVLTARLLRLGPRGAVLTTGLYLTAFPLLHNFKWGQLSVPLMATLVGAYLLAERRQVVAGVLLALAAATKLYPALFGLAWLGRGRRRLLVAFAVAAMAFYAVVPSVVLGPGPWWRFERATRTMLAQSAWIDHDVNSHYLAHVAARWYQLATGGVAPAAFVGALKALGWLLAAGLLGLLRPALRRTELRERGVPLVLLLLAVPFLLRTSWPHYFASLPLCQAVLLERLLARRGTSSRRRYAAALLPVVSMALASVFAFNLFPDWSVYNGWGLLCLADLALVPAAALVVLTGAAEAVETASA